MMNKKRNTWKLHFQNLTLSEDARDSIKKLLNVPGDRLRLIFWRIESLCSFYAGTEADANAVVRPKMLQGKRTLKGSVQARIKNLQDAIEGLDEYSKQVLARGYSVAYPHPKVSNEDKDNIVSFTRAILENQDSETSIWVPREYSGSGWLESVAEPLPFRGLLDRVKRACEESGGHSPKKSGLINGSEKMFVSQLITIFETYSGHKASTTPDAVFDKFLRAVLGNLDPEYPVDMDQSTIIRKALTMNRASLQKE